MINYIPCETSDKMSLSEIISVGKMDCELRVLREVYNKSLGNPVRFCVEHGRGSV